MRIAECNATVTEHERTEADQLRQKVGLIKATEFVFGERPPLAKDVPNGYQPMVARLRGVAARLLHDMPDGLGVDSTREPASLLFGL